MPFFLNGYSSRLKFRFRPHCFFYATFLVFPKQEGPMKQSDHFRENADNCALLAEKAPDEPTRNRYERMEAAWRALAREQDWLDGEVSPARIGTSGRARKRLMSEAELD